MFVVSLLLLELVTLLIKISCSLVELNLVVSKLDFTHKVCSFVINIAVVWMPPCVCVVL